MQPLGKRVLKDLLQKGKALWSSFSSIGAGTYASSIAYFTFLSLIPLITLCISLVSIVGIGQVEVAEFFTALVPEALDDFTRTLVGDAFARSGIAFSLSTVTLLWSASKGMRALNSSLNAAYGVKETRNGAAVIVISVLAAAILGVLLAVTIYLVFGGTVMRAISWVAPDLMLNGSVMNVMNSTALAVLGIVVLGAFYTYLPATPRRFTAQLPGAVFASLACGLLIVGFHVYVDNFCNFAELYGSIATVALFLLWIYLVAYILIAGGFVNRVIADSKSPTDPQPFVRQ